MKKLDLKVSSHFVIDTCFLVDGKRLKSKKDNFGNACSLIETDNGDVEIEIFNWNEMQGKLWFLTSFIFYIISIFGLLDIKQNKSCRFINCKLKVKLKEENNLKIIYNKFQHNSKAINYEGNCEVEEISNIYYIDEICRKRFKIMKWVKIATFVLVIVGLILFFWLSRGGMTNEINN